MSAVLPSLNTCCTQCFSLRQSFEVCVLQLQLSLSVQFALVHVLTHISYTALYTVHSVIRSVTQCQGPAEAICKYGARL